MIKRVRNYLLTCLIAAALGQTGIESVRAQGLFSFSLAPSTVVGNARALAGPGQAIPFSTLTSKLLVTLNGDCVATQAGVITCTINDTSAAAGFAQTKYNPLFFGNAGTGRVTRLNRLFCGEAALNSSDVGPVTTKDWLETLLTNTTAVAQLVCVDSVGQLGVLGGSRASDFRSAFGSSTGGAQGLTGIGYNDDTVGGAIAVGANNIGIRKVGALGITVGAQNDMNNAGSVVDIEPSATGIANGSTISVLTTPGAYTGLAGANITAGVVVGGGVNSRVARKGIVILSNAIDNTLGAGGGGVAIDLNRGQTIRWRNSTPTTDAEIFGNAFGFVIGANTTLTGGSSLTFNGSVSGGRSIAVNSTGTTFSFGGGALSVPEGGTGDTGTAWTSTNGAFACGTATFTNNNIVSKTMGKTTWINGSFTINALGTCTNVVTLTLPNTAAANGLLAQFNPTTNTTGACNLTGTSASASCIQNAGANYAAGNVANMGGVYTNQ